MEDNPLKGGGAAAEEPSLPPSATQQQATTRGWGWRWDRGWGRGRAKREYEEIIDDEETFWTELWRAHNLALPSCYTLVGFIPAFAATPLSIYLVSEINAHPTTQNQVAICTALPWAVKILFGFCSDACPLGALRRKPYMALGTLLSTAAYLALASLGRPSAPELGLGLCCATVGLVMADTMADALVVERSRAEPEGKHGHLQSALYAYRFGGAVAGAVAGALVYNAEAGWGFGLTFAQVMAVAGLLPLLLLLPLLVPLREMPVARRGPHTRQSIVPEEVEAAADADATATAAMGMARASGGAAEVVEIGGGGLEEELGFVSVSMHLRQIWAVIQLPIVYMPMAFVYCYNLLQIPNVAWTSFLIRGLDFTPFLLGSLSLSSRVMTLGGVILYKKFFLRSAWPLTYVWTTLLTAFFSILQLLLIFQINVRLGVSNFLFALGDEALSSFVVGIQFLPLCTAYLKLCPRGSESTVYSMLTTFGNIALLAGNSLGTLFGRIWDVSNGALERGDLAGLWKLTVLTSCLSPLPLLLLPLLPADAAQHKAMRDGSRASPAAGVVFLVVLFVSLGWIIGQAIYVLSLNETG